MVARTPAAPRRVPVRRRRRRRGRRDGRARRTTTSGASRASSPRPASSTVPISSPRTRCRSTTSCACCGVNLVGTFAVIKHALPHLVDGGGAIVTIASTAAIRGHGLRRGLHREQGRRRRAHAAARGAVRPARRARELHLPGRRRHADDRRHVRDAARRRARAKRTVPLGRYAQPEDIGDVAVFLLSDDARYVTGVDAAGRGRRDDRVIWADRPGYIPDDPDASTKFLSPVRCSHLGVLASGPGHHHAA